MNIASALLFFLLLAERSLASEMLAPIRIDYGEEDCWRRGESRVKLAQGEKLPAEPIFLRVYRSINVDRGNITQKIFKKEAITKEVRAGDIFYKSNKWTLQCDGNSGSFRLYSSRAWNEVFGGGQDELGSDSMDIMPGQKVINDSIVKFCAASKILGGEVVAGDITPNTMDFFDGTANRKMVTSITVKVNPSIEGREVVGGRYFANITFRSGLVIDRIYFSPFDYESVDGDYPCDAPSVAYAHLADGLVPSSEKFVGAEARYVGIVYYIGKSSDNILQPMYKFILNKDGMSTSVYIPAIQGRFYKNGVRILYGGIDWRD